MSSLPDESGTSYNLRLRRIHKSKIGNKFMPFLISLDLITKSLAIVNYLQKGVKRRFVHILCTYFGEHKIPKNNNYLNPPGVIT